MACPTCDHTMQLMVPSILGTDAVYWCPRCGTIKGGLLEVPTLVERCRELCRDTAWDQDELNRLGILESVFPMPDKSEK